MGNLTRGNILKGIDGGDWLVTNRKKMETVVIAPLLSQASELIEKYHDHPKPCNSNMLFSFISNQCIMRRNRAFSVHKLYKSQLFYSKTTLIKRKMKLLFSFTVK
ncbi:MAG TPA: hypothetical protein DCO90_01275 [Sphingobacterium sp.]|nr:hypothetical protein [Sphingobacterium sp.]